MCISTMRPMLSPPLSLPLSLSLSVSLSFSLSLSLSPPLSPRWHCCLLSCSGQCGSGRGMMASGNLTQPPPVRCWTLRSPLEESLSAWLSALRLLMRSTWRRWSRSTQSQSTGGKYARTQSNLVCVYIYIYVCVHERERLYDGLCNMVAAIFKSSLIGKDVLTKLTF